MQWEGKRKMTKTFVLQLLLGYPFVCTKVTENSNCVWVYCDKVQQKGKTFQIVLWVLVQLEIYSFAFKDSMQIKWKFVC